MSSIITESKRTVVLNSTKEPRCFQGQMPPVASVRGVTGSDLTSLTASFVTTTGSMWGTYNVESDSAANYVDSFLVGPTSAGPKLFDATGNAGQAPTASNFHPSFTAPQQAAIQSALSGVVGTVGFSFDKQVIIDEAIAAGIITDGIELTIESTVTFGGSVSPVVSQDTDVYYVTTHYSFVIPGYTGPVNATGNVGALGLANYKSERGSFGYTNVAGETISEELLFEGTSGPPNTFVAGTQLSPGIYPRDADHRFTQVADPVYAHLFVTDAITSLQSFGMFHAEFLDDDSNTSTPNQSGYARTNAWHPIPISGLTSLGITDTRLQLEVGTSYTNATNPFSGAVLNNVTSPIQIRQFPQGSGSFVRTGTEPMDEVADPVRFSIAAGGVDRAADCTYLSFGLSWRVDVTNGGTGDYYFMFEGTSTGAASADRYYSVGGSFRIQKY